MVRPKNKNKNKNKKVQVRVRHGRQRERFLGVGHDYTGANLKDYITHVQRGICVYMARAHTAINLS